MANLKRFETYKLNESGPVSGGGTEDPRYPRIKVVEKGDPHVIKMALDKIGDGEDPNMFFVTTTNDYLYTDKDGELCYYWDDPKKAPHKIEDHIIRETFGPYQTFDQAKKKAEEVELSEDLGPRRVTIDDRLEGPGLYERVMKAEVRIIWQEKEEGKK